MWQCLRANDASTYTSAPGHTTLAKHGHSPLHTPLVLEEQLSLGFSLDPSIGTAAAKFLLRF